MYGRLKKVEYINLVQEPGRKYLGLLTPPEANGSEVTNSIFCYLENNNFDYVKFVAIGCDATVTNTGWKNCVIRNLELKFCCLLQWFICLLHFNEFPIRFFLKV